VRAARRSRRSQLTGEALWDDGTERDALLGVYLPMADRIAGQALQQVGELVVRSCAGTWQVPVVQEVRDGWPAR
jgi:hypothetical protein